MVRFEKARGWLGLGIALITLAAVQGVVVRAGFITAPTFAVGYRPVSVAVGDFNGDGIPDLAVANSNPANGGQGSVSILLGNGDGTFQPAQDYSVGSAPRSLAVGDFNGDGIPDLAVANGGSDTVSILLGNGDGTFRTALDSAAGHSPAAIAVGDFNGDGQLDLAVANQDPNMVRILLGNGDGTFQAAYNRSFALQPFSLAVGDFNGDGQLDLAVADGSSSVAVLLGNGDGTFHPPRNYPAGAAFFSSVAVGDFNGDGILDLALSGNDQRDNGTVSVLLGTGHGTFQAPHSYPVEQYVNDVAVGDFNRDGHLDLVVAGDGGLRIMLGNGDGTLLPSQIYAPGATFVAVADFNGDGNLDLAVPNLQSNTVSVLLGKGQATFQAAPSYAAGSYFEAVAMADFNGDGHLDLVVTNRDSDTVSILLGNGDGTFQAAQSYAIVSATVPYPNVVVVGDFNGDGIPDLAVANTNADTISIFLGNGDGTFRAAHSFDAGFGVNSLAVGDFNGDGKLDIVTTNFDEPFRPRSLIESDVRVFLGNGDGTFRPSKPYTAGLGPNSVAVADFNGDGILDLAVTNGGGFNEPGSTVSILLGRGDGTFGHAQSYDAGSEPRSVVVGDFNGDGIADLAVANWQFFGTLASTTVSVLLGNGDGTFQAVQSYAAGQNTSFLAVGDFNGDGNPDLAVVSQDSTVSILLGKGDGTFSAAQTGAVVLSAYSLAVGDVNGDGLPDLAVGSIGGGTVTILLNAGGW